MQFRLTPHRLELWRRLVPALILSLLLASLAAEAAHAQTSIRYVNRAVNDGLVAHWNFDTTTGATFADVARLPDAGSPGTLVGATIDNVELPPAPEGKLNQASLGLNGVDGKAIVADPSGRLSFATAFTVGAQVKRSVDDGFGVIYAAGSSAGAWYVGFGADGHVVVGAGAQVLASSTAAAPIGQWVYVLVTKDAAGSVRFYLDGAAAGQGQAAGLTAPTGDKTIWGVAGRQHRILARAHGQAEHLQPRLD